MTATASPNHLAYSLHEAATLTGLSREELRRRVHAGDLDAKRAGRRILIPHAALERFVDDLPAAATQRGAVPDETEAPGVPAGPAAPASPVVVGQGPTGTDLRNEHGPEGSHPSGPR